MAKDAVKGSIVLLQHAGIGGGCARGRVRYPFLGGRRSARLQQPRHWHFRLRGRIVRGFGEGSREGTLEALQQPTLRNRQDCHRGYSCRLAVEVVKTVGFRNALLEWW